MKLNSGISFWNISMRNICFGLVAVVDYYTIIMTIGLIVIVWYDSLAFYDLEICAFVHLCIWRKWLT